MSALVVAIAAAVVVAEASAGQGTHGVAPGAPGAKMNWTPADKQGFGTSTTRASRVWFTLERGELTEVYYPRIDTPSFRDLQFVVTNGRSFVEAERTSTSQRTAMVDGRSLSYRQIDTDVHRRWRLTKTYVSDPRRSSVLIRVRFQSLTHRAYHLYVVANPQLSNASAQESGVCAGGVLLAYDGQMSSAIRTAPRLRQVSCGFKGTSDGLTDLREHHRMTWHYRLAPHGNVVQTGLTSLTGLGRHRTLTLALGFAKRGGGSLAAATASLKAGWPGVERRYEAGWHRYVARLKRPPRSLRTSSERREYRVSAMVLAASEDKTYRGAYVASPTMPWAWGTGLENPSGPYHLVWSRDLYEISTALIADGDVAGARRALHFLFYRQQEADGAFPQNSQVNGKPALTNLQLDEVADPIILAWQLHEHSHSLWTHVKRAADFIVGWHDSQGDQAPYSPQERWENQGGYSPATIASEIAGLVCAASIAERNGDHADAHHYLQTADTWQHNLNKWTLTTTGPYGGAYYLRLTKNGDPNSGVTYNVGDSGPTLDQRAVVDPSFLEMVRLGVKSPHDPNILSTIRVVDAQLADRTPHGEFWHRYTDDGYGEQRNGRPWNVGFPPGSRTTIGRLWPIFAGERGEYQVAAGQSAAGRLRAMAAVHNAGWLLPEQVWDQNPPSGQGRFRPGTPTFSATPLAWSQAQFIRLAWSIAERRVVEQPSIVACRYVRKCR